MPRVDIVRVRPPVDYTKTLLTQGVRVPMVNTFGLQAIWSPDPGPTRVVYSSLAHEWVDNGSIIRRMRRKFQRYLRDPKNDSDESDDEDNAASNPAPETTHKVDHVSTSSNTSYTTIGASTSSLVPSTSSPSSNFDTPMRSPTLSPDIPPSSSSYGGSGIGLSVAPGALGAITEADDLDQIMLPPPLSLSPPVADSSLSSNMDIDSPGHENFYLLEGFMTPSENFLPFTNVRQNTLAFDDKASRYSSPSVYVKRPRSVRSGYSLSSISSTSHTTFNVRVFADLINSHAIGDKDGADKYVAQVQATQHEFPTLSVVVRSARVVISGRGLTLGDGWNRTFAPRDIMVQAAVTIDIFTQLQDLHIAKHRSDEKTYDEDQIFGFMFLSAIAPVHHRILLHDELRLGFAMQMSTSSLPQFSRQPDQPFTKLLASNGVVALSKYLTVWSTDPTAHGGYGEEVSSWVANWVVEFLYGKKRSLGFQLMLLKSTYPELFATPWPLLDEMDALVNTFFIALASLKAICQEILSGIDPGKYDNIIAPGGFIGLLQPGKRGDIEDDLIYKFFVKLRTTWMSHSGELEKLTLGLKALRDAFFIFMKYQNV